MIGIAEDSVASAAAVPPVEATATAAAAVAPALVGVILVFFFFNGGCNRPCCARKAGKVELGGSGVAKSSRSLPNNAETVK